MISYPPIPKKLITMLLSLFQKNEFLDAATSSWIFDTFAWALTEFEHDIFNKDSQLILPINSFYPGNVSSIAEMAQSVFDNTLKYAGMQQWPIRLVSPEQYQGQQQMPKLQFKDVMRGDNVSVINNDYTGSSIGEILVSYNPAQINQPQDLVASFAQAFAAILISQRGSLPPGGEKFMPQAIDLVACFMGFGVMFANTAYQFKGGCGSCYNKHANREAALPEQEMVYCLALFSILKGIKKKDVSSHLKSHLRSGFKQAYKEINKQLQSPDNQHLLAAKL